jgi:hydroxymethylbilane synthase
LTDRVLRIGSRGSRLALWQATTVKNRLEATGTRAEIVVIKTTGDRSQTAPVAGDDTKRQFVKEIEDALLDRSVDVAVHSAKDMTIVLPDGLALAACLPREDPRDAIVLPGGDGPIGWQAAIARLRALPHAARVGTGSVRRAAQLASALPAAVFTPIRGNVDTRLGKVDGGGFDALILACAGLRRLGLDHRISAPIPLERCIPAPGQGIVAMEIRADDDAARRAVTSIHDDAAGRALAAEWAVVAALGGGCQLPLGAIAVHDPAAAELELIAVVASRDGARTIRRSARGAAAEAAAIGTRVATELERAGALELLNEVG